MKHFFGKYSLLLVAVLFFSATALAVTDEINRIAEQADKLYVQKRYSEAFPLMKQAAEGGDEISMFNLGTMYYEGQGTRKNLDRARYWWQKAADLGDTVAKEMLKRLDAQQAQQNKVIIDRLVANMVYVEGGKFKMGATKEQGKDAMKDEKPKHDVTIYSFYIGRYEVTQAEWMAVMGSNPSGFKGDNLPVENVSWNDCQEFIKKLNALTGKRFRLPTEAEWEYAARGGNKSRGYKYAGSNTISDVAWYYDDSGYKTHPVGTKKPNELGLYDMSGNVWEWCQDWYDKGYYSSSPSSNPTGPASGSNRVYRGGSWDSLARRCRVSDRNLDSPGTRGYHLGLRLAL